MSRPRKIKLIPDDYHAKHVGITEDQKQFFATFPFVPRMNDRDVGCEFIAVFIWSKIGVFEKAIIDKLGPRKELNTVEVDELFRCRIKELGEVNITTINVEPFKVKRHGVDFGLIYKYALLEDGNSFEVYEVVELHPGNYMAFHSPWDGRYDT